MSVTERSPENSRQPVLFDDHASVVAELTSHPGRWFLIGGGPAERRRVLSQTAYRIRRSQLSAFNVTGGIFETRVSTSRNVPDRQYPIELYCRFITPETQAS